MSTTDIIYTRPSDGRVFRAVHTPRPFYVRSGAGDGHFASEAAARRRLNELGRGQVFFDYAPGTGVLVVKL